MRIFAFQFSLEYVDVAVVSSSGLPERAGGALGQVGVLLRGKGTLRFTTYDDPLCPYQEVEIDKSRYTKPRSEVLTEIRQRRALINQLLEEME